MRVLVSKNGRKFFHLRYTFNKRKRVVLIGEYLALSVQEARDKANEFKNLLYSGLDPLAERSRQSAAITFAEFIEKEYVPYAKGNKKSWKDDVNKLEKDMLPEFGSLPLSSINHQGCEKVPDQGQESNLCRYL